jgi:hypothetical protein
VLQATWDEGQMALDRDATCGNPPRRCPWRLQLQHTPPSGAAVPINTAALEDVEVLVSYRLG